MENRQSFDLPVGQKTRNWVPNRTARNGNDSVGKKGSAFERGGQLNLPIFTSKYNAAMPQRVQLAEKILVGRSRFYKRLQLAEELYHYFRSGSTWVNGLKQILMEIGEMQLVLLGIIRGYLLMPPLQRSFQAPGPIETECFGNDPWERLRKMGWQTERPGEIHYLVDNITLLCLPVNRKTFPFRGLRDWGVPWNAKAHP